MTPPNERGASPLATIVQRIMRLGPGERVTIVGADGRAVADALRAQPVVSRGALLLAPADTPEAAADGLLDDLAVLALRRWPDWYGADDASRSLLDQEDFEPLVSRPWLKAATKRVARGHPPRFRAAAKSLELTQLLAAVGPGLLLIASLDATSPRRAAPLVQVLEWAAAQGAACVAALAGRPAAVPPFDRLLYGALEAEQTIDPVSDRFIAPRSRAHPASAIEARVEAALRRDDDLGALFSANELVPLSRLGTPPRVDFLWREGRVVVELDGPDHQADAKFAADRHRDYELLMAGYLVLRLTNDQIDTDLQYAIQKIRDVVRFRRSTQGGATWTTP